MPSTEDQPPIQTNKRAFFGEAIAAPAGLALVFGILFYALLSTHMVQQRPDGLYSGGSSWGDLAWHLSMISNFEQRGMGAVRENPIYPGTKLSYPFLPDLLSAWLVGHGISLQASLIWPSLLAVLIAILEMYWLARSVTGSYEALWVPFLFLFNGSLVGLVYFWRDYRASDATLVAFLNNPSHDYARVTRHNIQFSNVVSDYLLPQRAFVFGVALGLVVVLQLWRYWSHAGRGHLLKAGVALGLMPLVHLHSFAALAIAAAALFVIDIAESPSARLRCARDWSCFLIPLLLFAVPQTLWISPHHAQSFVRVQLGWMAGREFAPWFWLKNLFPHLLIFGAALYLSPPRFSRFWAAFLMPFLAANIVVFQPYDFDNMKLMLWSFLISCVGVAVLFNLLRRRYGCRGLAASILLGVSLMPTGFLSVYRELHLHWPIFSNDDIALASYARDHTPADAVFLTSSRHNHPIPCLAGRRIVMGYVGWLWSHGIDYHGRQSDVLEMFEGRPRTPELLAKYNISYVLIEFDKMQDLHENVAFFLQRYRTVYQGSNYLLLQVK